MAAPAVLGLVRAAVAAVESELRIGALGAGARGAADMRPIAPGWSSTPALTLSVLGRDRALLRAPGAETPVELSIRHSELLFLLSQHPAGYTADQLAIALHERDVPAVTVRAELSRLRSLVPDLPLQGRPYRVTGLVTDVSKVREHLTAGKLAAAVAAYPGPTLPSSVSPEVHAERDRLHREIRSAVLGSADSETVLRFANSPCGRDDLLVWRHAADLADAATLPVVDGHLARLEREQGTPPGLLRRG